MRNFDMNQYDFDDTEQVEQAGPPVLALFAVGVIGALILFVVIAAWRPLSDLLFYDNYSSILAWFVLAALFIVAAMLPVLPLTALVLMLFSAASRVVETASENAHQRALRRSDQNLRQIEAQAVRDAQPGIYSFARKDYVMKSALDSGLAKMAELQKAMLASLAGQAAPALPDMAGLDLLTALDNAQRTLIVGPSNAGKTTLLQHIISRRRGQVIVIDPHSYPEKWPCKQVVGLGRDYEAIAAALISLVKLMSQRYDEIGRGEVAEGHHAPVTIIIDEWRVIVQNVEIAGESIKTLLTESRKAAMSVFVATHSERAKPLGLEGEYDLKDGFSIVHLFHEGGRRLATIDTGQGHQPALLPGPFVINQPPAESKLDLPEPEPPKPDETESQILELWRQGLPKTRIAMEVFGSKGGKQSRRIEDVISTFGGATNE